MSFEKNPLEELTEQAEELEKKRTSTLAAIGVGALALIALKIAALYYPFFSDTALSVYIVAALTISILLSFRLWKFLHPKAVPEKSDFQLLRERRRSMLKDFRDTPEHIRPSEADFIARLNQIDNAIAAEAVRIETINQRRDRQIQPP